MDEHQHTWSASSIDILENIATKTSGMRWLHSEAAYHYRHMNQRFVYSAILLSSIASVGCFTFANNPEVVQYTSYAIGSLNIVLAMLASIQRFMMSAEKSQTHAACCRDYASLVRMIKTEIVLKRTPSEQVVTDSSAEYEKLASSSPIIPHKVIRAFNEKFPDLVVKPEPVCGVFNPSKNIGWKDLLSRITSMPPSPRDEIYNSAT